MYFKRPFIGAVFITPFEWPDRLEVSKARSFLHAKNLKRSPTPLVYSLGKPDMSVSRRVLKGIPNSTSSCWFVETYDMGKLVH